MVWVVAYFFFVPSFLFAKFVVHLHLCAQSSIDTQNENVLVCYFTIHQHMNMFLSMHEHIHTPYHSNHTIVEIIFGKKMQYVSSALLWNICAIVFLFSWFFFFKPTGGGAFSACTSRSSWFSNKRVFLWDQKHFVSSHIWCQVQWRKNL